MGFLDKLFTSKKGEQTFSTQTGTSTTDTENKLWDEIQPFFQQYQQQFSNFDGADTPINAYQAGAADTQTGVVNTAAGIANNGITPQSIQSFMNPYIQSVIDPARASFDIQNKQALSNLQGNHAVRGALGNNTGSEEAFYAGVLPGQQQQIASLYSQGFDKAGQLSTADVNARLAGVSAQSGANTAGYNMGQGIWDSTFKNNLTPYEIANQGVQGLGNLGNLAGQTATTNTSGTATGTATQTATPSTGGTVAGLIGTGMSLFSDADVKENIKEIGATFDGQPIYKYNYKGDAATQIGLLAQEVEGLHPEAVGEVGGIKTVNYDQATKDAEGKAEGGAVDANHNGIPDSLEQKVTKYFNLFQGLQKKARGGEVSGIEPYAGDGVLPKASGGDVGLGSWMPTVTTAPEVTGPSKTQMFGDSLKAFGDKANDTGGDPGSSLGAQQQALSSMLSGMGRAEGGEVEDEEVPSYAAQGSAYEGGAPAGLDPSLVGQVRQLQDASEATDKASAPEGWAGAWTPSFMSGVYEGQQMNPLQRLGIALTQVHDSPFAGFGKSLMASDQGRMEQEQVDEAKRHNRMAELAAMAKGTRGTTLEQNLIAAGYKPGTPEYQQAAQDYLRKAQTQIDMREESAYDKAMGPKLAEEFIEAQKAGAGAQHAIANLDVMKQAISDPNLYTGTGGQTVQAIKRAGETLFGVPVKGTASGEVVQSLGTELALGNREKLPGPMSNADREFLVEMGPSLSKTPEGNRLILEIAMASKRWQIANATAAREYAGKNQGRLDAGWYAFRHDLDQAASKEFGELFGKLKGLDVAAPRSPTVGTGLGDDFLGILKDDVQKEVGVPAP